MKAHELMTRDPVAVTHNETTRRAAELLSSRGVGALPVVQSEDDRTLVGIITDRDIVIRCVAAGHQPTCTVKSHMTPSPIQTVMPQEDIAEVISRMEHAQVRRIPVVNPENRLLGIIAQADIARKLGPGNPQLVDEVLEYVSAPSVPALTGAAPTRQ